MTRYVQVSKADISRAKLLIALNDSLGRTTPQSVRKIAAAKPLGASGSPASPA